MLRALSVLVLLATVPIAGELHAQVPADNQALLLYANAVGGQDGLIFDGGGFVFQNGRLVFEASRKVLADPALRATLEASGNEAAPSESPAAYREWVEADGARERELSIAAGAGK